ncbi:MAG: helix-turn-helix domain-containing protein [Sphingobium sp.]
MSAEIDVSSVREALRALFARIDRWEATHPQQLVAMPEWEPGPLRIATIIAAVARETGVSQAAICGPRRELEHVRARAAVAWLARRLTSRSYPAIGMVLGGRDHSTIIAAERKAVALRVTDPAFRALTVRLLDHFRDLEED